MARTVGDAENTVCTCERLFERRKVLVVSCDDFCASSGQI